MKRLAGAAILAVALALPAAAQAQYSVKTMGDVVQLRDAKTDTVVSVLTPVSNAYEMVVKGHNILHMPFKSLDEMRARPGLNGIPLLAPFANRLDEEAFYANGQKYNFDMGLGNVHGPIPAHGYLMGASEWKVVQARSDASGAWVTNKLDFYRYSKYMKQFPFAHTLTMTYRLSRGVLEVRTRIDNLSAEPMPVSIGFHPHFMLTDSVRQDWMLSIGGKTHWLLGPDKLPTGQTEPSEKFLGGDIHAVPMSRFAAKEIDEGFSDFERDAKGRGGISLRGAKQSITVTVGPKFRTMLVYSTVPDLNPAPAPQPAAPLPPPVSSGPAIPFSAIDPVEPPARGVIAIEPMVGITDAMNLAQKGLYKELQSIAPGGHWQESFWITPRGY